MNVLSELENVSFKINLMIGYLRGQEQAKENKVFEFKKLNENFREEEKLPLKYGQGTISKRTRPTQKGTYTYWQARYYSDGFQHTITAKTQKECLQKLKEINKPITKKREINKRLTLEEWLNKWYKLYKANVISKSTAQSYTTCIKKHITKELKMKYIFQITASDVQQCINSIEFPRQQKISFLVLQAALKQAYEDKLTKFEAWKGITVKKHQYKKSEILEREDEPALLNLLSSVYANAVKCYLWTGCRLMELLKISEPDIDRNKNLIQIKGTKTKNAVRVIPLFAPIKDLLPLPHICARELQAAFKKACNTLNLKLTIHSLRHTFATRCLEKNINIKTIQRWLGHSSYKTTADIYTHYSLEFEKTETEKMKE